MRRCCDDGENGRNRGGRRETEEQRMSEVSRKEKRDRQRKQIDAVKWNEMETECVTEQNRETEREKKKRY